MKISDVIVELTCMLAEHGDIRVVHLGEEIKAVEVWPSARCPDENVVEVE